MTYVARCGYYRVDLDLHEKLACNEMLKEERRIDSLL